MNVMPTTTNNYNTQFGKIIPQKGGKKILKQILKEGRFEELAKVFKEADENFAADIFVGEESIGVLDKLTGKKYFPSGKLLQKKVNNLAIFKEVELLEGSAKQEVPLKEARGRFEYLYLGEKNAKSGFFSKPKFVNEYFEPKENSSYIIRQQRKFCESSDLYEAENKLFAAEDSPIHQLVSKFNTAIEIAHDIKFQAEQAMNNKTKDAEKAIDAFLNNLINVK